MILCVARKMDRTHFNAALSAWAAYVEDDNVRQLLREKVCPLRGCPRRRQVERPRADVSDGNRARGVASAPAANPHCLNRLAVYFTPASTNSNSIVAE